MNVAAANIIFYGANFGRIGSTRCRKTDVGCEILTIPRDAAVLQVCFAPDDTHCVACIDSNEKPPSPIEPMDVDVVEFDVPKLQVVEFNEYIFESSRVQSFVGWPQSLKQTPQQLAEAGFFHTQKEDRVICFCCGGGLWKWAENDDPWEQHALHYDDCAYVQLMKGSEYVAAIKKKLGDTI